MFNSIRYRFITIYFLLVLLCLSIVGAFIINRLETQQISSVESNMNQTLNTLVSSSGYLNKNPWVSQSVELKDTLSQWRLSPQQTIYAISYGDTPEILASTSSSEFLNRDALTYAPIDPSIVLKALQGEESSSLVSNVNASMNEKHIAKPIFSAEGNMLGILYMTEDLSSVYDLIHDAKIILTNATLIALVITTILGYFIANSITGPIRDVTTKASAMAQGNFDQVVEVKSDDEIGNLGEMFNYLTEELKMTMGQMELEKSKLNTIFNYMAEGVIAVNRAGYIIHANPTSRQILNLPEEYREIKKNLNELNIMGVNYYDPKTLEGESVVEIQNQFYKVKYAPYKRGRDMNLGLIVVLQDITKEHELDSMRKEFVANVSHELKTPITTIKSYSETILDSDMDLESAKKFIKIIDKENDRMGRLVSDLLQLSSIDYKNFDLNFEEIDTYDVINQTLESLRVMITEKKHHISLDIPMEIKNILADMHSLEQIMMNIVSNAIKYTNPEGTIKISASSNYFNVKIVVEDNGVGIPKEDLPRIFERFYRVEKGRSRKMGGTGLGLSIAKELAISMGGNLEIESALNEGTKVTLTLKAA